MARVSAVVKSLRTLDSTTQKHGQTSVPQVGLETTIPVFEHALDSAGTLIGVCFSCCGTYRDSFSKQKPSRLVKRQSSLSMFEMYQVRILAGIPASEMRF